MARLRFEIKGDTGDISLPVYSMATMKVVQLLRELDSAISGRGGNSLNWYVENLSKNGSLTLEVQSKVKPPPKDAKPRKDVSVAVANSFITTFENIQDRGISPPYLSEYGLEKLQAMMGLLHKNGAKSFVATAVDQSRSISVTEQAEKTLRALLPPTRIYDGTVEGRLETVSVHKEKKFVIYHSLTRKAITCAIASDTDLQLATNSLGRKVMVFGRISVNVKNEPLRVSVTSIRVLGAGKRLPSASELTGSDPFFVGDMTTDEYIRSIRRG
jgi:hypothetical protein